MSAEPLKVLLVEDNDDDAALILAELNGGGYRTEHQRVYSRESMRDALENDQDWDVIISDHNLPGFSSTEALLLLLENEENVPFIIVSGTIGEEQAVEAMKAGARDYVMKDKLSRLVPAVRNAIKETLAIRARRRAEEEIKESRKRLRELASHLESVREEERHTIARDIHDELGGILTALKMDISWLRKRCPDENIEWQQKMVAMGDLADSAIQSVRRIITELRPSILDDLGLIATLEWQLNDFSNRYGIATHMRQELGDYLLGLYEVADGDAHPMARCFESPEHAVAVFRIFQEGLTNVARHARASSVWVTLTLDGERLSLEIEDDGVGIDGEKMSRSGSYGILGMHERALQMGGEVEVTASTRGGCRVGLWVPVREK